MAGNKKRKKSRKKHCNSKREVFQMVQDHINEKHPQQSRNIMAQKLQTINRLKPVLQATRGKHEEAGKDSACARRRKVLPGSRVVHKAAEQKEIGRKAGGRKEMKAEFFHAVCPLEIGDTVAIKLDNKAQQTEAMPEALYIPPHATVLVGGKDIHIATVTDIATMHYLKSGENTVFV